MYQYPYGDSQQLNLDWILSKLKELEASAGSGNVNLEEVSNALISATFSSSQAYNRSDIVFRNGKLYRANVNIPVPGESWNPAHWDEILIGDTLSNVVTYLAALNNSQVFNSSNVPGTHTSDALDNLQTNLNNLQTNIDDTLGNYEISLNSTFTSNAQNYPTWEQGTIDTSGTLVVNNTRIRTKFIDIPYDTKIIATAKNGYKISVKIYKGTDVSNGLYYSDTSWQTSKEYLVPTNCAIRIVYAKTDDSTFAPADITAANAPTLTVFPLNMPAKKINHNKILFIGNSTSLNCSEYLCKTMGDLGYLNTEVICTYKAGITLQQHYDNRSSSYYTSIWHYKKNVYGYLADTIVPLTQLIVDNPDITHVIFQQANSVSSDSTSYSCLGDLIALFNGCNAIPKFYLLAQWAANDTTSDTDTIMNTYKTVAQGNSKIQGIIPVGQCVEEIKANSLFTNNVAQILYDGKHLHNGFPKTLAALSVIETLFGLDDRLYLSDGTTNATYLINNLCFDIAKRTSAYHYGEYNTLNFIPYKTYTFSNVAISGFITGASKEISCFIQLPLIVESENELDVTNAQISLRDVNGGYIGSAAYWTDITSKVTAAYLEPYGTGIRFGATDSNTWHSFVAGSDAGTATNNTPIIGRIRITFKKKVV